MANGTERQTNCSKKWICAGYRRCEGEGLLLKAVASGSRFVGRTTEQIQSIEQY